jgi:hypothetical protein
MHSYRQFLGRFSLVPSEHGCLNRCEEEGRLCPTKEGIGGSLSRLKTDRSTTHQDQEQSLVFDSAFSRIYKERKDRLGWKGNQNFSQRSREELFGDNRMAEYPY